MKSLGRRLLSSVSALVFVFNGVAGVTAWARRSDGKNVAVLTGSEALFLDSQS